MSPKTSVTRKPSGWNMIVHFRGSKEAAQIYLDTGVDLAAQAVQPPKCSTSDTKALWAAAKANPVEHKFWTDVTAKHNLGVTVVAPVVPRAKSGYNIFVE